MPGDQLPTVEVTDATGPRHLYGPWFVRLAHGDITITDVRGALVENIDDGRVFVVLRRDVDDRRQFLVEPEPRPEDQADLERFVRLLNTVEGYPVVDDLEALVVRIQERVARDLDAAVSAHMRGRDLGGGS